MLVGGPTAEVKCGSSYDVTIICNSHNIFEGCVAFANMEAKCTEAPRPASPSTITIPIVFGEKVLRTNELGVQTHLVRIAPKGRTHVGLFGRIEEEGAVLSCICSSDLHDSMTKDG